MTSSRNRSVTLGAPRAGWRQVTGTLLLCLPLIGVGCQVTGDDLQHWTQTQNGPTKLVAVMSHAKYRAPLRVDAALALVSMKPRGGRRVGIDAMLDAFATMPATLREEALPALVEHLAQRLVAPPPAPGVPDESIAYKDAAFELLSRDQLLQEPGLRGRLRSALAQWAMADFFARLEAPTQRVGMQQMLSVLGPDSVKPLPELIEPKSPNTSDLVRIVAEVGKPATKSRAAEKLVQVASYVSSEEWLKEREQELKQQDPEAFAKAGPQSIKEHLDKLQEDEVLRVFSSFKRLGEAPTLRYLSQFAADEKRPEKLRAGALAAMEGHAAQASSDVLTTLFSIAEKPATSGNLRGLALLRIGEADAALTRKRLDALMTATDADVRFSATELVLGQADKKDLPAILRRLGDVEHMSVGEPLRYGRLLGAIDGLDVNALDSYISKRNAPVAIRLTALGYYYAYGVKSDVPALSRVSRDQQAVPECDKEDDSCSWYCDQTEVKTVGDFYDHCVEPHMKSRDERPAKPEKPGGKTASSQTARQGEDKNAASVAPKASQDAAQAR